MAQDGIRTNLKKLIVTTLNLDGLTPERIADDEPLFGAGLGLDSVDALELVVALEKEYGISIASHEVDRTVFGSLATWPGSSSAGWRSPSRNPLMASEARDRRAVITGLGAVSAFGWGVPALREGLRSRRTAIGPFQRFDHTRHRTHVAGEVPEGPPADFVRGPRWPRLSLADRFAVFAAREALAQAGLAGPLDERAAGVYFGSSTGGMLESERYLTELVRPARAPRSA